MAWLQKRPQVSLPVTYFTSGQNNTLLLVGLGNPGAKYAGTRHNIGFECIDYFVEKFTEMSNWAGKTDLKCLFSSGRIGESQVIAIKPTTFMNLSGESVASVVSFYKAQTEHLVVIHDELDINFGQIRTRVGGQDAGHNGIKSISEQIGENYGRIRLGVGPKTPSEIDSADFVLQKFSPDETKQISNLKRECNAILSEFIYNKSLPTETRSFIV
ncbi:MAG: aminoacyl-tRNA hydrolase [Candidatus Saccharimonadales bacterium]